MLWILYNNHLRSKNLHFLRILTSSASLLSRDELGGCLRCILLVFFVNDQSKITMFVGAEGWGIWDVFDLQSHIDCHLPITPCPNQPNFLSSKFRPWTYYKKFNEMKYLFYLVNCIMLKLQYELRVLEATSGGSVKSKYTKSNVIPFSPATWREQMVETHMRVRAWLAIPSHSLRLIYPPREAGRPRRLTKLWACWKRITDAFRISHAWQSMNTKEEERERWEEKGGLRTIFRWVKFYTGKRGKRGLGMLNLGFLCLFNIQTLKNSIVLFWLRSEKILKEYNSEFTRNCRPSSVFSEVTYSVYLLTKLLIVLSAWETRFAVDKTIRNVIYPLNSHHCLF